MEFKNGLFFFFPAPQVSAWGPCFRSVDLFTPGWNGGFHLWRYSGVPLGRLASTGGFSPFPEPWVPVYLVSWALSFRSYCLRHCSGCGSSRCSSCSSHPSPAWFSSKTPASWVLTVASDPDSERAFAFGCSLCSVSSSASSPSTLVACWCDG